jgi:hypothetical protein
MAYVRNNQGVIGQVLDKDLDRAIKQWGYTHVTDAEVSAERTATNDAQAVQKEAASHPIQTAAEGAVKGAVDVFTAIPRAVAGGVEAVAGPNAVTEAVGGMTGENALAALHTMGSGMVGPIESQATTDAYMQSAKERAAANPVSAFAGELGGSVAGFGPLGKVAGVAAGTAGKVSAGVAGKAASLAAESAVVGGTMGVAGAAEDAHHHASYLRGQQALVAAGLGTVFAGGLLLGGKVVGKAFAGRRAPKSELPDLEIPAAEPYARKPYAPEPEPVIGDLELPSRRGTRAPEPEPALELPVRKMDALEKPITAPDLAPAGGSDIPQTQAFPRRTRYARGARDVLEPEYAETELPIGGRPGANVEVEELRSALNGEALNSKRRADKVAKLMEVAPEGAHPDWVRNMTSDQRYAMTEYLGLPEASEHTWKAFEDALAHREGYVPDGGKWALRGETLDELAAKAPANAPAAPYQPGAGINYQPEPPPEVALAAPETPYRGPYGGPAPSDAAIGESAYGAVEAAARPRASARAQWEGVLTMAGKAAAYRTIGYWPTKTILGGAKIAGGVGSKLLKLANRGGSLALDAVDYALQQGQKLPGNWTEAMAATAGAQAHKFMSKGETPETAFAESQKHLTALQADNGALIRDQVVKTYGALGQVEKGALQATIDTAHRGVDYLQQAAPKTPADMYSLTPISDTPKPSRADISDYARVYDAVMHPTTVLRDIANGTVTSDQIQAIRFVYPDWFQANVLTPTADKLRARDAAGQPVLPAERKVFDTILQVHSGVDSTQFVQQYASAFAEALGEQVPPPAAPKGGKSRGLRYKSGVATRMQTQTSKMLGGGT